MLTFHAKGVVWGRCWGGGECGYDAKELNGYKSRQALIDDANRMLKDGSLDSGMGFEKLLGVALIITEQDTRVIDGKMFSHVEKSLEEIGEIPEDVMINYTVEL